MIGSLRGVVLERGLPGEILIEVGGVGYRVSVTIGAIVELEPGADAFLFIHQHVRDDALLLFGFLTRDERDTFELLITASGVGPKLALAILSVHSPAALRRCLAEDDLDALVAVPGVGKRTAQRLLVDLKARLVIPDLDLTAMPGTSSPPARVEVRDALVGLGYSNEEVREVFGQLGDDGTVEDLLRDALRTLAGRG
ncbi:MAG TPA: Holliday junction branch migration protein RuvA [Acidimicrobiia bacterium]|nr:Holliday junction branch migration protein RuvA [Acidimicrobiia bacterium]